MVCSPGQRICQRLTFGTPAAAPESPPSARISSTLASASMNRMSAPAVQHDTCVSQLDGLQLNNASVTCR